MDTPPNSRNRPGNACQQCHDACGRTRYCMLTLGSRQQFSVTPSLTLPLVLIVEIRKDLSKVSVMTPKRLLNILP